VPTVLLHQVLVAGAFLFVMSTIDTLAYSVRTAGVLTRRLAISMALFNVLVIVSRLGNMIQAPIIGNLPDKVFRGAYTSAQVLGGLRLDVCFIITGVIFGGLLTPSFINIARRGIAEVEQRGSMPVTIMYGLRKLYRLPFYLRSPLRVNLKHYLDFKCIPIQFQVWNIFVTCFYTIGVMSTVLAASWDHSVSGTAILLSGIVNGMATMLLFLIVDPPAAVIVDQCINGKRPERHAKIMNLYLILTRMLGCLLALLMLPPMGRYVLYAAHFVDQLFPASASVTRYSAEAQCKAGGLDYHFGLVEVQGGYMLELTARNQGDTPIELTYSSGGRAEFTVSNVEDQVWSSNYASRFTQALEHETIPPDGQVVYTADWQRANNDGVALAAGTYWINARLLLAGDNATLSLPVKVEGGGEGK
jgi:hypothetical protein